MRRSLRPASDDRLSNTTSMHQLLWGYITASQVKQIVELAQPNDRRNTETLYLYPPEKLKTSLEAHQLYITYSICSSPSVNTPNRTKQP
jgi:hypothetical protein